MGLLISSAANATWFESIPRSIKQPDGTTLDCFVTGDQYARRLHDELDYTIVMDERETDITTLRLMKTGCYLPQKCWLVAEIRNDRRIAWLCDFT